MARNPSTRRQDGRLGHLKLWTVGHSTHLLTGFLGILTGHEIRGVADVRRFPASRRYPHYNGDALATALAEAGIEYHHFPDLGGRRTPRPGSTNTAWRNESFRGYADHMETEIFRAAAQELVAVARDRSTAIMCAEALWWRCHRALIADYLKVRGISVLHISDARKSAAHEYTSAATVTGGSLSYAPAETDFGF